MKNSQIDTGKKPDEPTNIQIILPFPSETPFGNLALKYMKIISRLDEANRKIAESYQFWRIARDESILSVNAFERHIYCYEEAIYMMRRAADELVSLIYFMDYFKKEGIYPDKIKIDCLGAVKLNQDKSIQPYTEHTDLINILNDISNAFKHSFINSDINVIGDIAPRINALGLRHNNLSDKEVYYDVTFEDLIEKYNNFFSDCQKWLKNTL